MNDTWSKYIQTTEELYISRNLRFREETKALWLNAIGAGPGDRVLEIGCGGGAFCHRLKQYVPGIQITGLDLDTEHIAFAKRKAAELGLEADFVCGDAAAMPFGANTFDLCYSYTVSEHIPHAPFFSEQYRVLKPGGRISVLSARPRLSVKDLNGAAVSDEERALMEKAWQNADLFCAGHPIGAYEIEEHAFPMELERAGFRKINVELFTFVDYGPDNASVPDDLALEQINCRRVHSLASMRKALALSPDALSGAEQGELARRINERYDKRIEQYKSGLRVWDFSTSTTLAVTGVMW